MGRWTPLEAIDERLTIKVTNMIGQVGPAGLQQWGKTRKALREEVHASLRTGRAYVLNPERQWTRPLPAPPVAAATVAQGEFGR